METRRISCIKCGTVFTSLDSVFYSYKCNVCIQTETIQEQNRINENRRQEEIEHQQRIAENAAAAARAHYQRQEKILAESSYTSQEVYNIGYNYIDNYFNDNNYANLSIKVKENGSLTWNWNHTYITERLQESFRQGLNDRLSTIPGADPEYLKRAARQAGKLNAEGTLDSYFSLHTNLEINGVSIPSIAFDSKFVSHIDEETGELKMNWFHPFQSQEFNNAYLDGVNEVYYQANTEEKKQSRLKNEVVAIKRDRRKGKIVRFISKLLPILLLIVIAGASIAVIDTWDPSEFWDTILNCSVAGFVVGITWGLIDNFKKKYAHYLN